MGSNYAPTLWIGVSREKDKFKRKFSNSPPYQEQAAKNNCHQVLWLFGEDHEITEVGAMNIFVFLDKGNGRKELVTPTLESGVILPGVTRTPCWEHQA